MSKGPTVLGLGLTQTIYAHHFLDPTTGPAMNKLRSSAVKRLDHRRRQRSGAGRVDTEDAGWYTGGMVQGVWAA